MFRLLLENVDTPPTGDFELGHVTVCCDGQEHSSRDMGARGLVMIYLAAADLLDGAGKLRTQPRATYVFEGAGSSWGFTVHRDWSGRTPAKYTRAHRDRRDDLRITTPAGAFVGFVSRQDYGAGVWNGVQQLIAHHPPAHGAARSGLRAAMDAYQAIDNQP